MTPEHTISILWYFGLLKSMMCGVTLKEELEHNGNVLVNTRHIQTIWYKNIMFVL